MSNLSLFLLIASAHLLAVASPGPDFAVVLRQTLRFGRPAGIATALGIGSGILFHAAYALFGLTWLLQRFPTLLDAMRYLGAAVLLWIAWGALRSQPLGEASEAAPAPDQSPFWLGLLTNLFNGKAMLFFIALCSPLAGRDWGLKVSVALWMSAATMLWFSGVACGVNAFRQPLRRIAHWLDRGMGVVLVALAVWMLWEA
jgi:threonine/homoserine/homoserine lactone efflux protein